MPEKILINQELADRFEPLLADLAKLDLAFVKVSNAPEVVKAFQENSPKIYILSAREACDLSTTIPPSICIVLKNPEATDPGSILQEKGFQVVLNEPITEVQLLEEILNKIKSSEIPIDEDRAAEESKRVATRVDISGPLSYIIKGVQKQGWAMNASRTGISFASVENIKPDTALTVRFDIQDKKTLDLATIAIRSTPLESPEHGCHYLVGAKFNQIREPDLDRLDTLMEDRSLAMAKQLSPIFLKELLANGEKILVDAFQKEINPTGLAIYLKEVGPFEREAFSSEGEIQSLVRKLVALRMQCYAFRIFLPAVKANRKYLAPTVIPMLGKLIQSLDEIEKFVEKFVKAAKERGEEFNRKELNESSNRSYQAKIKLLTAVADLISPEGLGPEAEIIQRITARVRVLQELKVGSPGSVRYEKRVVTTISKVKEAPDRPKKGKSESTDSSSGSILRIGMIAGVASIAMFFFMKKGDQIKISDLQIGIPVDKVENSEQGMMIYSQSSTWRNLPRKTKEDVAGMVENVLRKSELTRATLLDEKGTQLLAIQAQETPTGVIYQRSFPKK